MGDEIRYNSYTDLCPHNKSVKLKIGSHNNVKIKFEFGREMDYTNGPIEMPDIEYTELEQPPTLN